MAPYDKLDDDFITRFREFCSYRSNMRKLSPTKCSTSSSSAKCVFDGHFKAKKYIKKRARRNGSIYLNQGTKIVTLGHFDVNYRERLKALFIGDLRSNEYLLPAAHKYLEKLYIDKCSASGLNGIISIDIIPMLLYAAIIVKRKHFKEDILQLIKIVPTPNHMLHSLGISNYSQISLLEGICFKCAMPLSIKIDGLKNCRILLINCFHVSRGNAERCSYTTISQLNESTNVIRNVMETLVKSGIQVILSRCQIDVEIEKQLASCGILAISGIDVTTLKRIAFATKCPILTSLEENFNYGNLFGVIGSLSIIRNRPCSIVALSNFVDFRGFSIILSNSRLTSFIISRIKHLIKSMLFVIQGTLEQIRLISDLGGSLASSVTGGTCQAYATDNIVLSSGTHFVPFICWLNIQFGVGSDVQPDIKNDDGTRKRYFAKGVQYIKYSTCRNEICGAVTLENVSSSDYSDGHFTLDILKSYLKSIKSNVCTERANCPETFINHKMHYETLGSSLFLKRATLQPNLSKGSNSSVFATNDGDANAIVPPVHLLLSCTICNSQTRHCVGDVTFGRLLEFLLHNMCFLGPCGHKLSHDHCFSLVHENMALSINIDTITIYHIEPKFTRELYNCTTNSVALGPSPQDKGLQRFRDGYFKACRIVDSLYDTTCFGNMDIKNVMRQKTPSLNIAPMLVFGFKNSYSDALLLLHSKIVSLVASRFKQFTMLDHIENAIPCPCEFGVSMDSSTSYDNNKWTSELRFTNVKEFLQQFETLGVFGIEPNSLLLRLVNDLVERRNCLVKCQHCQGTLISTAMDFDILNWLYIFSCVVNGFVHRIRKIYYVILHLVADFRELDFLKSRVLECHSVIKIILLQCTAHLINYKVHCPPDPMSIYMVVKCFFCGIVNAYNRLVESIESCWCFQHMQRYNVCSSNDDTVGLIYLDAADTSPFVRVDDIDEETAANDLFLSDFCNFVESCYLVNPNVETTVKHGNKHNLGDGRGISLKQFIADSKVFAFQCGHIFPQDDTPDQPNEYYALLSKICMRARDRVESIITSDYSVVSKSKRDVGVIIAECLHSVTHKRKLLACCSPDQQQCSIGREMMRLYPRRVPHYNFGNLQKNSKIQNLNYNGRCRMQPGLVFHGILYKYLKLNEAVRYIMGSKVLVDYMDEHYNTGDKVDLFTVATGCDYMPNICRIFTTAVTSSPTLGQYTKVFQHPFVGIIQDFTTLKVLNQTIAFDSATICTESECNVEFCPLRTASTINGIPVVYLNNDLLRIQSTKRERRSDMPLTDHFMCILINRCITEDLPLKYIQTCTVKYSLYEIVQGLETTHIIAGAKWQLDAILSELEIFEVNQYNNAMYQQIHHKAAPGFKMPGCNEIVDNARSTLKSVETYSSNEKYKITVYYPMEFHTLRHFSFGDDLNYIRSLCKSSRMHSTSGKSGALLFVTYDGKLTIKLLNKYEMQLFLAEGPKFFRHILNNDTFLSVPFGLYSINHLKTNTIIHCLVMQNIDYHCMASEKISFDLKGLSFKRFKKSSKSNKVNNSSIHSDPFNEGLVMPYDVILEDAADAEGLHIVSHDLVLLDQNYREYTGGCPLRLDKNSLEYFHNVVGGDLELLASLDIVDYSLLVRLFPSSGYIALGLIDFLRPYTWDKQIETIGKKLANIATGQAPTIISPRHYRERFLVFLQGLFSHPRESEQVVQNQTLQPRFIMETNVIIPSFNGCKFLYFEDTVAGKSRIKTCPEARQYLECLINDSFDDDEGDEDEDGNSKNTSCNAKFKLDPLVNFIV